MKKTVKSIITFIMMLALSLTILMPANASNLDEAETKAAALKQLGLFKGVSETNFDLNRAPTRTEALVMLIRLLGKESEALNGNWPHPFIDAESWADKYIGYGYAKGLTKGVSNNKFGTGNADSDMYLTFVLRALNYNDTAGDFTWNAPDKLAAAVGILPDGVDTGNFLRADVVLVSWAALEADLKGGTQRLAKKLLSEGIFTGDGYTRAIKLVNEQKPEHVSISSAEALKAALSDKTVKVISIDSIGKPVVVTDELTIPARVTVTVNRGNDLYIEGTLTNNGTINVMGADSITKDFINYSVMSVQNGGKIINNGVVNLHASLLEDTDDHGPVGGQLRLFDGTFTNKGSVFLKAGLVNTHGGMVAVIDGTFNNDAIVIVDGFFLHVENGVFNNNIGAVVINNSHIFAEETGKFTNNGTLSGNEINE
ncbi:MAG TPA: hypothetical protein PK733_02630 [Clostridiales bacterium]|nr:hypothetical protein [Clostridiales bacterium]